jgi:hypothetical protein
LRSENILSYPAAKSRTQALAFRPLHENDERHQNRYDHVDGEDNVDRDVHLCECGICLKQPEAQTVLRDNGHCLTRSLGIVDPLYLFFQKALSSLAQSLCDNAGYDNAAALAYRTTADDSKLQSFVIHRNDAEGVRRFFRRKIKQFQHRRAHHPLVTNERLDNIGVGVARARD